MAAAENKFGPNEDFHRRLRFGRQNQVVQDGHRMISDLSLRHFDRAKAWLHRGALRQVVEANDRNVVRDRKAAFTKCAYEAKRDDVIRTEVAFGKPIPAIEMRSRVTVGALEG